MNPHAELAANTVLALQGQNCVVSPASGDASGIDRCIAKPSLDQSAGGKIKTDQYDISIHYSQELKNGDQIDLLDASGVIEKSIVISVQVALLGALRIYIGQVL
ncbi:MAG: hypothetical protein RPR40_01880 [Bermanella sp.]